MKVSAIGKGSKVSAIERRKNMTGMLMLLPSFIMFSLLVLYPTLWALRYVFYEYDGFTRSTFVGFDNIIRLFTREESYWNAVGFTFKFAACKLVIELPLAVGLGVLLNSKILRFRNLFRGIYYMPVILSASVMEYGVYIYLFTI